MDTKKKTQKKCPGCGKNRRINQAIPARDGFHKKKASKDGYQNLCKVCRNPIESKRRKITYRNNREQEIKAAMVRYKLKTQQKRKRKRPTGKGSAKQ